MAPSIRSYFDSNDVHPGYLSCLKQLVPWAQIWSMPRSMGLRRHTRFAFAVPDSSSKAC